MNHYNIILTSGFSGEPLQCHIDHRMYVVTLRIAGLSMFGQSRYGHSDINIY